MCERTPVNICNQLKKLRTCSKREDLWKCSFVWSFAHSCLSSPSQISQVSQSKKTSAHVVIEHVPKRDLSPLVKSRRHPPGRRAYVFLLGPSRKNKHKQPNKLSLIATGRVKSVTFVLVPESAWQPAARSGLFFIFRDCIGNFPIARAHHFGGHVALSFH